MPQVPIRLFRLRRIPAEDYEVVRPESDERFAFGGGLQRFALTNLSGEAFVRKQ